MYTFISLLCERTHGRKSSHQDEKGKGTEGWRRNGIVHCLTEKAHSSLKSHQNSDPQKSYNKEVNSNMDTLTK